MERDGLSTSCDELRMERDTLRGKVDELIAAEERRQQILQEIDDSRDLAEEERGSPALSER